MLRAYTTMNAIKSRHISRALMNATGEDDYELQYKKQIVPERCWIDHAGIINDLRQTT